MLVAPFGLIAIPSLVAAVAALCLGRESGGLFALAGFFGIPTAFFGWFMLRNSMNVLVFTGSTGVRLPLWFNNPSQGSFEDFVSVFRESIKTAQTIRPDNQTLAGEIEKIKELLDRGILDRNQFESAKNRLTGNEENRRVGF